uniref:BTB domain-containing protein n=1 Tax=Panagrellus redivivus TaxID=6233 RepID=A0A7E4VAB7_PANRE
MSLLDYSDQYLNKKLSDVTLVIDGTELTAHRSILCERSDYFKAMFSDRFAEGKADRIVLKEASLKYFEVVLKHIYFCNRKNYTVASILPDDFDEVFKVYACAKFYTLDELMQGIISYLEFGGCPTIQMLNNAMAYSIDYLVLEAARKIKYDAHSIVELKIFENLTAQAVEYLLKLKLNTRQSTIFEALVSWMRLNTDKSDLFPKFLKLVDLYILSQEDLEILFKPTKLIDRKICQELINEQAERAKTAIKIVNENVINDPDDLCVLKGIIHFRSLCLDCRSIQFDKDQIIIDLKHQFYLNCLKFEIKQNKMSYTVHASLDSRDWQIIINHSKYDCFGPQVLYFNERPVRFIRINANPDYVFSLKVNIEALYSTEPFEVDPDWALSIPNRNIMPSDIFTTSPIVKICGEKIDQEIRHLIVSTAGPALLLANQYHYISFRLSQPYIIGSMKLQIRHLNSYFVLVSTNLKDWTRVFTEENVEGWRTVTFEKQPVLMIKIVGTKALSPYFRIFGFECPALEVS